MVQNQRQDNRHSIRLPKLADIPNLRDLQGLQIQAQNSGGKTVEAPFGEPPEDYILTVVRDKAKSEWLWMLYRGSGSSSMLEWSYHTPDCGVIHNVISAQFPGQGLAKRTVSTGDFETDSVFLVKEQTAQQQSQTGSHGKDRQVQSSNNTTARYYKPTLEGELRNMHTANLLQSISMGKMTGRLEVDCGADVGNVYFNEGAPVHCTVRGAEGDPAIVEIVGWTEGEFRFFPEPVNSSETVKKRLDWLLMEGAAYDDQQKYLKGKGLALEAIVIRKAPSITEAQFEQAVSKGAVSDMRLAKMFFQAIDSKSSLVEVLRRRPLSRTEWIPILYTLVSQDLVELVASIPEEAHSITNYSAIDWTPVRTFEKNMLRQDTQIYTYPAFLYFLEKEMQRFERFNVPFAIVLIDIGLRGSAGLDPLPLRGLREAARRIERLKRKTDTLAHYETFSMALLLPHTDYTSARSFAARIEESIMSAPLSDDIQPSMISLKTAASSCPESSTDLRRMLGVVKLKS